MKMIEKYVYAVTKRLPLKTREDMGKEIESFIMDELEDRFGKKEIYDDNEISFVLKEMGPPYKTAALYREDESYLIGPPLFELYRLIITIAAGAVTLGLLISHIIRMFEADNNFLSMGKEFLLFFPILFSGLFTMVGVVTVIFYLFQKFGKASMAKIEKEFENDWNPKDLPDLPEKEEVVKIWEPILGIFFTILALVLLNTLLYSDSNLFGGKISVIFDIFNRSALRTFAPLWNISLTLGLLMETLLIPIGRRDRRINLVEMIINLFDITVKVIMIRGPLLVNIEGIRNRFTVETGSFVDKFLLNADTWLDRLFMVLIIMTAIGFTVKMVKVIRFGRDCK